MKTKGGELAEGKVLLLEDNHLVAKIWKNLLEKEDFEVVVATSGEEAVSQARSNRPDVVILDIVVPEGHGFQVFQTLKLFEETKNVPVIFLTSLNRHADRRRALELGAAGYFIKSPLVSRELIKKIRECITGDSAVSQ